MEIFGDEVERFLLQYPCDARAADYLRTSTPEVIGRAIQEFKPPREGERDYSALLVTFVKSLRGSVALDVMQATEMTALPGYPDFVGEPDLLDFRLRYPCDEEAYAYLANSSADVQRIVLREFKAKTEGEHDYSALVISFTKRCRNQSIVQHQREQPPPPPTWDSDALLRDILALRHRYPFDEDTYNYLMASSAEVQAQVLSTFKPPREGESDYSALLISFTKRCRSTVLSAVAAGASLPPHPGLVMTGRQPSFDPTRIIQEVEKLRFQYPFDDDAYNYIMNSPPDVQVQVLQQFKPPREGEPDYSSLIISFTKRCRTQAGSAGAPGLLPAPPQPQFQLMAPVPAPPPALQPCRALPSRAMAQGPGPAVYSGPPVQSMQSRPVPSRGPGVVTSYGPGPAELANFRARFPMDDRAFMYLEASPPEVQGSVLSTFAPSRPGDTEFSAAVIAYAKALRNRMGPNMQPQPFSAPPPRIHGPANGLVAQRSAYLAAPVLRTVPVATPPRIHGPAMNGGRFQAVLGGGCAIPQVEAFRRRYPMDQRAYDYLQESGPEVIDLVLQEFRAKREGDPDYSAAVVAFTRRCRENLAALQQPPWKRGRVA